MYLQNVEDSIIAQTCADQPNLPPKTLHRSIFLVLCTGIIGAIAGFGIGNYGGFPAEEWLWMVIMGVSGCFLARSHKNASWRKIAAIIVFYGLQIAIFTFIGTVITMTGVDSFGLAFGLRYGVLLSILLGIYAQDTPYEILGGFFLLFGFLTGGGAGIGALMGFLFAYDIGLCAIFGFLMAGLIPYFFLLLSSRIVFLTFIIMISTGLQVGFFLNWSLLQCFYVATIVSLGLSLIFSTVDYICIYALKQPPVFGTIPLSRYAYLNQ